MKRKVLLIIVVIIATIAIAMITGTMSVSVNMEVYHVDWYLNFDRTATVFFIIACVACFSATIMEEK